MFTQVLSINNEGCSMNLLLNEVVVQWRCHLKLEICFPCITVIWYALKISC